MLFQNDLMHIQPHMQTVGWYQTLREVCILKVERHFELYQAWRSLNNGDSVQEVMCGIKMKLSLNIARHYKANNTENTL